jgi:hypothetical protein
MPSPFDQPCFTQRPDALDIAIDVSAPALPMMIEPSQSPVTEPIDEPMGRVEHRRIRTLSNYWHAGWKNAIPATW